MGTIVRAKSELKLKTEYGMMLTWTFNKGSTYEAVITNLIKYFADEEGGKEKLIKILSSIGLQVIK